MQIVLSKHNYSLSEKKSTSYNDIFLPNSRQTNILRKLRFQIFFKTSFRTNGLLTIIRAIHAVLLWMVGWAEVCSGILSFFLA